MIRKTYDGVYFKALDDATGEFEAVVSVFGNVDLQGDRSMPGMFLKSLAQYRDAGNPIPVIWSHDWGDPFAHIGYVDPADAREILAEDAKSAGFGDITGGLFVKGHLDVDKPFARQVYDLLKERRIREWSFAYDVEDEARAKDGANELKEVNLFEVGPTLKGANPATATIGVKSILDDAAETERGLKKIMWAIDVDEDTGMKLLKDWVTDTSASPNADAVKVTVEGDATGVKELAEAVREELLRSDEAPSDQKDQDRAQAGLRDHLASDHGFMEGGVDLSLDVARLNAIHAIMHGSGADISDVPKADDESTDEKSADLSEVAAEAFDHGEKAGRALSLEREQAIRAAIDALTAILPVEGEEVDAADTEKSAEADEAKAELEEYKRKLGLLDM